MGARLERVLAAGVRGMEDVPSLHAALEG